MPGVSYYRLRQTDFDGQEEAFDWVSVKIDQPSTFTDGSPLTIDRAYPNPFTDRCTVTFRLDRPGPLEVQLVDMQETIIVSQSVFGYIGENQLATDNLIRIQPGTYLMRLVENGKMSPVTRVLKK